MKWKKLSSEDIKSKIFGALDNNVNFYDENILGVPASHLDGKVFQSDVPFLKDAPYLSTLVRNPNHIGLHTSGSSESFFKGTHEIEKEVIKICSNDILKGEGEYDGYIASGGTEANMQAIWIYRNYFIEKFAADINQICIICSEDSHYSMNKAANILNIGIRRIKVDNNKRTIDEQDLKANIYEASQKGIKYFIVIANMMTTMFGSVDNPDIYSNLLKESGYEYKLHIDGAYGGFFYPFSQPENKLNFSNLNVDSITLDAHKMAQAPYGTGIFLCRKGLIQFASTREASYVEGEDNTIVGSRSGANAIAVWMILSTYGPNGYFEKILVLQNRTDWLCSKLDKLSIDYFREKKSNIVTIKAEHLKPELANKYGLVPDNHVNPKWYKIVIMDHVLIESLEPLVNELL
ncbi:pyridoxal-dependent decarboxylase [Candidatus Kapabacteria bacterium]|nr:pyridoxal-dependent decarboxylase [Candidatus Kapabacteria bacterium]